LNIPYLSKKTMGQGALGLKKFSSYLALAAFLQMFWFRAIYSVENKRKEQNFFYLCHSKKGFSYESQSKVVFFIASP